MDLRDTDLADSESAVTQMTLYMYDLDQKRGTEQKNQLYQVWLSPNLPITITIAEDNKTNQQSQLLEWEGLIEMQLNLDTYKSIKTKVFQKDLLEGTLISNLQKIFVMPIYKELSDLHIQPNWRSSQNQQSNTNLSFDKLRSKLSGSSQSPSDIAQFNLCEALPYMRRICDHFKAFCTKLDTHLNDQLVSIGGEDDNSDDESQEEGLEETEEGSGEGEVDQVADWVGRIATYVTQVIALKVQRIKQIGDKNCATQLVSDLVHFKKLIWHSKAQVAVYDGDTCNESLRVLNQVQLAMVLDPNLIRLDPMTREIRIDIEGALTTANQQLMGTLKQIETHDEFSTQTKVRDLLSDRNTALLIQKRVKAN